MLTICSGSCEPPKQTNPLPTNEDELLVVKADTEIYQITEYWWVEARLDIDLLALSRSKYMQARQTPHSKNLDIKIISQFTIGSGTNQFIISVTGPAVRVYLFNHLLCAMKYDNLYETKDVEETKQGKAITNIARLENREKWGEYHCLSARQKLVASEFNELCNKHNLVLMDFIEISNRQSAVFWYKVKLVDIQNGNEFSEYAEWNPSGIKLLKDDTLFHGLNNYDTRLGE